MTVTQVVEPFFQSGMLWETWQHGPGPLPQYCPAPHSQQPFSFTIATVAVPGGAGWYVNQDHSKWGVTSDTVPSCCDHQVASIHWWSTYLLCSMEAYTFYCECVQCRIVYMLACLLIRLTPLNSQRYSKALIECLLPQTRRV